MSAFVYLLSISFYVNDALLLASSSLSKIGSTSAVWERPLLFANVMIRTVNNEMIQYFERGSRVQQEVMSNRFLPVYFTENRLITTSFFIMTACFYDNRRHLYRNRVSPTNDRLIISNHEHHR